MKLHSVVLCLFFAAFGAEPVCGQLPLFYDDRPLDEIKGMRRVRVISPIASDRAAIEKQLNGKHGLRVVRGGSWQFQLDYMCIPAESTSDKRSKVNINVITPNKDPIPIVWKRREPVATCNAAVRTSFIKEFLKDFGRMSAGK